MPDSLIINDKIASFNDVISVSGDKSISIRWVLLSSLANGVSNAKNLLLSEDVLAAIKAIKILGINSKISKNGVKIYGRGINGYNYKKNVTIDAANSGTLGRLILGLLINTTYPIKIIGDNSLSKRDFRRVTEPLSKFGAQFKLNKSTSLPLTIFGSKKLKSVIHPYLIISAKPAINSLLGNESKVSISITTHLGWWNAPIMFFPKLWLTAVLPPGKDRPQDDCKNSSVAVDGWNNGAESADTWIGDEDTPGNVRKKPSVAENGGVANNTFMDLYPGMLDDATEEDIKGQNLLGNMYMDLLKTL